MLESEDSYNMCVDQQLLTELGSSSNDSKKNSSRKRRFSDDQVKSLECMFETQTKLEPRKKLQLARELGLQPRQVAIWFQNKRARWKSKQLEREYSSLRADYDALLSSFESLEKEQQSLLQQLQKLADLLEKPTEGNSDGSETNDNGDTTTAKGGEDGKASRLAAAAAAEGADLKLMVNSRAEEEEEEIGGYSEKQEPDLLLYGGEAADRCLVLADQRCCFNGTGGFSDQSCSTSSQWWEFWPLND